MLKDDYPVWFSRLVVEAHRWVYDHATAEDLASTAIERCLRAEQRGQILNLAYAYQALRSVWYDHLRRGQAPVALDDDWDGLAPEDEGMIELRVRAVISFLPPHMARVFLLIADGYSHAEIGAQLGISEDSCKHRVQRMRARIKREGLVA